MQLDSWWYPHEVLRPFDTDEWVVPPTGMVRWEPRADVLPDGIEMLRERLDRRPLVAHCRHLSSQSPYCDEFDDVGRRRPRASRRAPSCTSGCSTRPSGWGVEVFEHDWLIECFLGVRELRAPGRAAAWQEGIDAGLGARDLHAQWCMASPADFAQTSRLRNVTSIRTSGDHGYMVGPEVLWAWFLHTNVMARALGLWPYKDVFHSAPGSATREVEALLAALSAGPVGIGDPIGDADVDLIRRTCRADGVLVRPDVPVAAIDRAAVLRTGVVGRRARRQRAHAALGRPVGLRGVVQRRLGPAGRERARSRWLIWATTGPRPRRLRSSTGGPGGWRCWPPTARTRSCSSPPTGTTACSRPYSQAVSR